MLPITLNQITTVPVVVTVVAPAGDQISNYFLIPSYTVVYQLDFR